MLPHSAPRSARKEINSCTCPVMYVCRIILTGLLRQTTISASHDPLNCHELADLRPQAAGPDTQRFTCKLADTQRLETDIRLLTR